MDQILAFAPYIVVIGIFYFLIIRPQSQKRKAEKECTESLKVGAKVVTTSGIHGKVNQINEEKGTLVIETGAGKITFERAAVSAELSKKINEPKSDKK